MKTENKKTILLYIRKNVTIKNKIISYFFYKYTLQIYEMGFKDAFNWNSISVDEVNHLSTIHKLE